MSRDSEPDTTRRNAVFGVASVVTTGVLGTVTADINGAVTSVETPSEIQNGNTVTISVTTTDSTATVIAVDGGTGTVSLSHDEAIENNGDEIRFIDIESSDSTYEVEMHVEDMQAGKSLTVAAWVNNKSKANADDVEETTITVQEGYESEEDVRIDSVDITGPETVTGTPTMHTLTVVIDNVSADNENDTVTITMPEEIRVTDVVLQSATNVDAVKTAYTDETVTFTLNPQRRDDTKTISTTITTELELVSNV